MCVFVYVIVPSEARQEEKGNVCVCNVGVLVCVATIYSGKHAR